MNKYFARLRLRWNNIKWQVRMMWDKHFPLVWKKDYQVLQTKWRVEEFQSRNLKEELTVANKVIDEVLPKLRTIKVFRPYNNRPTFRLQMDFADDFVYRGFVHGNSQDEISYIARRLATDLERELLTINFARLEYADPYRSSTPIRRMDEPYPVAFTGEHPDA